MKLFLWIVLLFSIIYSVWMPTIEGMTSGCSDTPEVMVHKNSGAIANLQKSIDKMDKTIQSIEKKNMKYDNDLKDIQTQGNALLKKVENVSETANKNEQSLKMLASHAKSQVEASQKISNGIKF
jgi:peptidoglycan hydrolase CwlO-like protein